MQIIQGQFDFPEQTGARQPSVAEWTFAQPFQQAFVVIRGLRVGFAQGEDHHFGQVFADLSCEFDIATRHVTVHGNLGLRDKSTDFDDRYGGVIYYTVVADP